MADAVQEIATERKTKHHLPVYVPGKPVNPGGRPKGLIHLRKLAAPHTREAIETLVKYMRSDDARVAVAAAIALLDRAYGRPGNGQESEVVQHNEIIIRWQSDPQPQPQVIDNGEGAGK